MTGFSSQGINHANQASCRGGESEMVRARGLEPLSLTAPDPKSGVSAIPPRAQCYGRI